MTVETPGSPHILDQDSHAIGAISYRGRQSQKDHHWQGEQRPATGNDIQSSGYQSGKKKQKGSDEDVWHGVCCLGLPEREPMVAWTSYCVE